MKPEVEIPESKLVSTALGTIECIDTGNGPVLLTIHGAMGGCDQAWLLGKSLLSDQKAYRTVAVSRPGYLRTPLSLGASPEAQSDLLAALLDRLGIQEVAVAAISAGGPSAIHFAARHSQRRRRLILISAVNGRRDTPPEVIGQTRWMARLTKIPGLAYLLERKSRPDPVKTYTKYIPDQNLCRRTLDDPEAGPLLRALRQSSFRHLSHRTSGTINDIEQFTILAPLPLELIRSKTLMVYGTADSGMPFSEAQMVQAKLSDAELMRIEDGGHMALFTHLREIRMRVAAFLV